MNMATNTCIQDQASIKRMQWRCRRGMLELDLLFTPFVETFLPHLDHAQIVALDTLLDMPDNALWELLASDERVNDAAIKEVMAMLRGDEMLV